MSGNHGNMAMAGLPEAHLAVVDERKVRSYLLANSHPAGRAKAAFFRQFGFRASSWQNLSAALMEHALNAEVASVTATAFGTKYMLEGAIEARDGRTPRIRTVWFVANGETAPRLVTAYPVPRVNR